MSKRPLDNEDGNRTIQSKQDSETSDIQPNDNHDQSNKSEETTSKTTTRSEGHIELSTTTTTTEIERKSIEGVGEMKRDTKTSNSVMDTVINTDVLDNLIDQDRAARGEGEEEGEGEGGRGGQEDEDNSNLKTQKNMSIQESEKEDKKEDDDADATSRKKKRTEDATPNYVEQHNANRVVPESSVPPTCTLLVRNFVRPFHNISLKKMLEEFGAVTHFWINNIKSFCYVTYSTIEYATAARNGVHDLIWPPNNKGQPLEATFVPFEQYLEQAEKPSPPIMTVAVPKVGPPTGAAKPPPTKTLDELFLRTTETPRIYYLPLTKEEVNAKLAALGQPPLGTPQPSTVK